MRVKKFITPTYFISDKIRKHGFKQNISIKKSYEITFKWISKKEISILRDKWYTKASKL